MTRLTPKKKVKKPSSLLSSKVSEEKKHSSRRQKKLSTEELVAFTLKFLDEHKAQDILSIDLKKKTSLTDYLIIASGSSTRQVLSLARLLTDKFKEIKIPYRTEGEQGTGEWIIIDLGDIIIHIFHPHARAFYEIEELWGIQTPINKQG